MHYPTGSCGIEALTVSGSMNGIPFVNKEKDSGS